MFYRTVDIKYKSTYLVYVLQRWRESIGETRWEGLHRLREGCDVGILDEELQPEALHRGGAQALPIRIRTIRTSIISIL